MFRPVEAIIDQFNAGGGMAWLSVRETRVGGPARMLARPIEARTHRVPVPLQIACQFRTLHVSIGHCG
ncbi:hypothetical protein [Sphingomonas sp. Leaf62]|uniref:hypothetical protein n=1 Tax=Sphingomonas sp. Leaf62 TaxID=1736228 RepID=UPI000A5728BE|nr:hypothetical protein [Sphingomonas sp. Leaf62]